MPGSPVEKKSSDGPSGLLAIFMEIAYTAPSEDSAPPMQEKDLYKVALATLFTIGAVLALGLMVRGLYLGVTTLVALITGGS